MKRLLKRFSTNQSGATALEYALLVTCLSVVVAAGVTALGTKLYALIVTTITGAL